MMDRQTDRPTMRHSYRFKKCGFVIISFSFVPFFEEHMPICSNDLYYILYYFCFIHFKSEEYRYVFDVHSLEHKCLYHHEIKIAIRRHLYA